ncbi:MAG: outer membrane beta-barrel protein [Bacteroidota bacterium]
MKKNNLDDLFKEKFSDFQEVPDNSMWERINASLDKKRKKRVIPIWWQLGGAAALLAILLYIVNPFEYTKETDLPVVDTELQQKRSTPEDALKDTEKIVAPGSNIDAIRIVDGDTQEMGSEKEDRPSGITSSPRNTYDGKTDVSSNQMAVTSETLEGTNENKAAVPLEQQFTQERQEVASTDTDKHNKLPENSKNTQNGDQLKLEEAAIAQGDDENKKSIYEAIEDQEALEKDVIAMAAPKNRWSMGATLAPVYFNSLGEGSPIHSNFAPNSKSGKINLSYGVTVAYNVSKKLSIRSGVHKVDFGYDTNDIVFSSSLTTSTNELIDNINYAQTSRNLVVEPKANSVAAFSDNIEVTSGEIAPLEGRMVQQLGYVEVPMELNYALVDKKLGINIIGGVSSLFLIDNTVSLESEDLITEMGEANNVNSLNFSTNIGVGFNYKIAPKVQFNVEPMFKYQLNTFSDTAGNFRPYSIGVYSGLNYRF